MFKKLTIGRLIWHGFVLYKPPSAQGAFLQNDKPTELRCPLSVNRDIIYLQPSFLQDKGLSPQVSQ